MCGIEFDFENVQYWSLGYVKMSSIGDPGLPSPVVSTQNVNFLRQYRLLQNFQVLKQVYATVLEA